MLCSLILLFLGKKKSNERNWRFSVIDLLCLARGSWWIFLVFFNSYIFGEKYAVIHIMTDGIVWIICQPYFPCCIFSQVGCQSQRQPELPGTYQVGVFNRRDISFLLRPSYPSPVQAATKHYNCLREWRDRGEGKLKNTFSIWFWGYSIGFLVHKSRGYPKSWREKPMAPFPRDAPEISKPSCSPAAGKAEEFYFILFIFWPFGMAVT